MIVVGLNKLTLKSFSVNIKLNFCVDLLNSDLNNSTLFIVIKAEFTHPVSACVYRIELQFFITNLGFDQSR